MQKLWLVMSCMLLWCCAIQAQHAETDAPAQKGILNLPGKVITGLQDQYARLTASIEKQNEKLLQRMQEQEAKLRKKLKGKDSASYAATYSEAKAQYDQLFAKLHQPADSITDASLKEYLPGLDSVQTSIGYLLNKDRLASLSNNIRTEIPDVNNEINKLLPTDKLQQMQALQSQIKTLQTRLQQSSDIQSFIRSRHQELKDKITNSAYLKNIKGINKEVYYYQQRLQEYKDLLNDKEKLKEKLLSSVRELPAFKKFMSENSNLSKLFRMPGSEAADGGSALASLAGLQTRAAVTQQLMQRMGTASTGTAGNTTPTPEAIIGPQLQAAQSQLQEVKNKLSQLGTSLGNAGANSDMTMPKGFKPNDTHTKTFLQRITYSMQMQSQSGNAWLPTTSDIALMAGYKLNDNINTGLGVSYKLGWGEGWKNIRFTNEGFGIRGFSEWKARGSFWMYAGFEMNYLHSFSNLRELSDSYKNNISLWQRSALAGLSKKYPLPALKKGESKKQREGSVQVLYDLLHRSHQPNSQALVVRVGWGL